MPAHVNLLSYKAFAKKKTLHAASQGVTASFPLLPPPKGRHELPCEMTPKTSPLGASGAKDDAYAIRRLARAYAREKSANPSRQKILPLPSQATGRW
jgi:hypothetical protein